MAVVTGSAEAWAERNKVQAGQLLGLFTKAKLLSGIPDIGSAVQAGGDHQRPQGLFAPALFPPFVWPEDSEAELQRRAETEGQRQRFREGQSDDVHTARNTVFTPGVWQGEGADAADAAYAKLEQLLNDSGAASKLAKRLIAQAASDVERTKRLMTQANNAMHAEIEAYLRSGSGQSLAQIAVITSQYRAVVQAHMADLHTFSAQYTTQMLGNFPLTPEGGSVKPAGLGTNDASTEPAPETPTSGEAAGRGIGDYGASSGIPDPKGPSGSPRSIDGPGPLGPSVPGRGLPSPLGSGGLPMSGLPSMPGGGGGASSPLSGLQGLFSGMGFPPGASMSPASLGSSLPSSATPSAAGMDFGRGLAAGVSAAGGAVSAPMAPLPQALSGPLAAPVGSAPTVAAPAAASSTAAPSSAAPSASTGMGMPAGGLTPYGSVLPPASSPASASSSVPAVPPVPAEGGAPAGAGPGTGLVPAVGGRAVAGVSRDDAASDVELAKMAVAELAGASCVVDAGLDWAVAVGHNGSGGTTLWVATNDGTCYVPPGVFLRNGMAVAGGFDEDFDARWQGWSNPAEKAVRGARANGDKVGAVATTWAWPSEFLEDPDNGVRQVAIGVPHAGPDGPASELRRTRMHRLQTVNAGLYATLKAMDEGPAMAYCRELTRRAVFAGAGELSPVAQAVAEAVGAGGWPKAEEWAALTAEYESDRLMMAAQRPGLSGLEDPAQVVSYQNCFVKCRVLEMLLCWKRSDPLMMADVVYAAWVAGCQLLPA